MTQIDRPSSAHPEGNMVDDIAIVGYSFKLPQGTDNDLAFWDVLENRRNLRTDWPESRLDTASFLNNKSHKFSGQGGHFLSEDVAAFDAPFFSVTAKEASAMDPMQRLCLETTYRAFEKSGIPVEKLRGSKTAVFSASMLEDFSRLTAMDPDNVERTAVTGGTVSCIIPNRISWYFDLRGPSIQINTACSSSLSAVDMACKSLASGDASCAVVTGANLLLDPSIFQVLSDQNFLSPDGVSYSFDHRANGYARGEGILAIVLKPLAAALEDGDMIRAVIRSIGSNQDGRTPVLTQPSPQAQEDLIRHVYKQANLDLHKTRYVEAHGTGTPVGDPIEMKAIGRVFRKHRSSDEPLYVGSIKANIGHLEGASALAALVKAILILEKGIIHPNALFEKMNPDIDADFYNVAVPTSSKAWPSDGLRRVSVNSFGFGGSNSHIVLDDALHYLEERGLTGNHCTVSVPNLTNGHTNGVHKIDNGNANGSVDTDIVVDGPVDLPDQPSLAIGNCPKVLVWSAADEKGVKRTVKGYEPFYQDTISGDLARLDRLAHTLASRRSHMLWRTFSVVQGGIDDKNTTLSPARPIRSSADLGIAFVFTGQGAQYVGMGLDLIRYPIFEQKLRKIDEIYRGLGCEWSIFDELSNKDNIDKPQYSQPLSTAIQIALVDLLASFGVTPKAVVGHSSGEIAAAYAAGTLSLVSACKVSYFRGLLAGQLKAANAASPGAMMSINLAEDQVSSYLNKIDYENIQSSVCIACINSPINCTLSGPEAAIDAVKAQADKDSIFAQKLKTGVAYHSDSMRAIANQYLSLMGDLEAGGEKLDLKSAATIPTISSVTAKVIRPPTSVTKGQYWVDNMVSPVRFADAVQMLTQESSKLKVGMGSITDLIEVGSHPALKRSVQDTVGQTGNKRNRIRYTAALNRSLPPVQTTLELVGELFCLGHNVDLAAVNQQNDTEPSKFLVDCPEYPFDKSNTYWAESRLSRDYRLRGAVKGETIGVRVSDWNPLEPRWRNFLCLETHPWIGHHKISDTVLYPASGMLVMAIEAVQQMVPADRSVAGYAVERADFSSPIIVQESWEDRVETQISLRLASRRHGHNETGDSTSYETVLFVYAGSAWTECFRATIHLDLEEDGSDLQSVEERHLTHEDTRSKHHEATKRCSRPIDSHVLYRDAVEQGLQYGDSFQLVQDVQWNGKDTAIAKVDVSKTKLQTSSLVHPAILDQAFHVLRVSASQQSAANVPIRLTNAWFASKGWQSPDTTSIRWLATSTAASKTAGDGEQGTLHALADDGRVLCTMAKATTAAITRNVKAQDKKLLYSIEWKPQLSMLEPAQLARACDSRNFVQDERAILVHHEKLSTALELVAARTLKHVDKKTVPEGLRRHVEWMEHHVSKLTPAQKEEVDTLNGEEVEARLCEVDEILPSWKLYTTCARKLPEMLSGETDPLEVVFESDQANIFYEDLFQRLCADGRLGSILDLAAHENPALRILEVGAGTGGMTGHVITALQEREKRTGGLNLAEYSYTDISPAFFEKARSRWPDLESQGRITFKTLDLDRPIDAQGFEPGSYDLVVAASVMHATPYLEATIRNVKKALKPGGKLLLLEVVNPDDIATNFMAGLVPGWWVAREEWRPHSAAVPEDLWDWCLRRNGFSGNDLVIRDYQSDQCHIMSIIVTTAVEDVAPEASIEPTSRVVLIDADPTSEESEVVRLLKDNSSLNGTRQVTVCQFTADDLGQNLVGLGKEDVVICLAEVLNKPLLSSLSENGFKNLQYLIKRSPNLLWAVTADIKDPQYADYSVAQGFFRSIRAEQADHHIVNVSIEGEQDASSCAKLIVQVFETSFGKSPSKELEYVVRNGMLHTGRAAENVPGNDTLRSLLSQQAQEGTWGDAVALKLQVGKRGALESLHFVSDDEFETELGPDDVEIEAKAFGLADRDVQAAMGRIDADEAILFGSDCAGVITRLGSNVDSAIQIGDRVCMVSSGCMRKYPRAHKSRVVKIPEPMSFENAVSVFVPGMTAHHALVDIARVEEGDNVLIHSAAGSVGQQAVGLAQSLGAVVYATVGSSDEKQLVMEQLNIPTERIFYYGARSLSKTILRATGGEGVDVVLNSHSGEDLTRASYECLASGGRFVGLDNVKGNAALSLTMLSRNITLSVVDIMSLKLATASKLMKSTLELLENGTMQLPQPLHFFNVSQIEEAFQSIQNGTNAGRTVVTPQPDDIIKQSVQEKRAWNFDSNASYLIAGGSGGLGRAIMKWMVDRGAKHLIVPSRSGASSRAASEMVSELSSQGVTVFAPKCDVASHSSLANVLEECAHTMPPIKGCINAAMVLQDAVFQDSMMYEQWNLTMSSKVKTSWNLHSLLPQNMDFFILLASLAGIAGQMASANYAAGCTFQDALARYRMANGQKGLSLDIGWMKNIGIIAETGAYQRQRQTSNDMQQIDDVELLAVLTMCCDPERTAPLPDQARDQILIGLRTPADLLSQGQAPPTLLDRPLFGAFSYITGAGASGSTSSTDQVVLAAAQFRQTSDSGERIQLVLSALAAKLARAMSISPDDVEHSKSLSSYGVDSLMAVELRNWIGRDFGATVAVFDILGGVPISSIADLIVSRSTLGQVSS